VTTGRALLDILARTPAPTSGGFNVHPIPGCPGYRVGRSEDGSVVLLTPADVDPDPPTRLLRVWLDPTLHCRLFHEDGEAEESSFGVVRLRQADDSLVEAFLDVAAGLVDLIGPGPAPGAVSSGMRRITRLFDPVAPVRGSVLGLWSELVVIDLGHDLGHMMNAWHAFVDSRFDFAAEGQRLEVKATTLDHRSHHFSLEQLLPAPGLDVVVASIMTTETNSGTSLRDLVNRLRYRLTADPHQAMRLNEQVAQTLGPDWASYLDRRFYEAQAKASLVFLPADGVGRPAEVPTGVSGVRFVADCSQVLAVDSQHAVLGRAPSARAEQA
jgi:hypothetical protein